MAAHHFKKLKKKTGISFHLHVNDTGNQKNTNKIVRVK
jgi:hypothetical protein